MICEVCKGRGWTPGTVKNQLVPAVVCGFCGGRGALSWGQVAKKLGENRATLARVRQMRSKSATCARVLGKVANVLWPKQERQREMFS